MPAEMLSGAWPEPTLVLPHAGPMLLISKILAHDAMSTRCEVDPGGQTFFRDPDGRVPCWTAIEYMAQCVAAHAGLRGRTEGQSPRIGFLVGSPRLRFHVPAFDAMEMLEVEAKLLRGSVALGALSFDCSLRRRRESGGAVLAEGRISIAIPSAEPRRPPGGPVA